MNSPDIVTLPYDVPGQLLHRLDAALGRAAAQQPAWPEPGLARAIRALIAQAPPVVTPGETDALRSDLAQAAAGRAFVLQGGDCAETLTGNTAAHVQGNMRTLMQMAGRLGRPSLPVIKVGRVAGQFAKPRSSDTDACGLPVYRGDLINSTHADAVSRVPDPTRMLSCYANAVSTLGVVRGVAGEAAARPEIYASHEALLLDYERAMVRVDNTLGSPRLLDLSGHYLWVGERTRQPDGAHIALAEVIANPVGVKVGAGITPEEAVRYAERLDPGRVPGRLTLVCRMGAAQVREVLPPIVAAVTAVGHPVVWQCDPMHGNTYLTADGRKTRDLDAIADEVAGFFEVHQWLGTHPGGLHLELTGDDVTECAGGSGGIRHEDLGRCYETACDPRLNPAQALEIADLAAGLIPASQPAAAP